MKILHISNKDRYVVQHNTPPRGNLPGGIGWLVGLEVEGGKGGFINFAEAEGIWDDVFASGGITGMGCYDCIILIVS